MHTRAVTCHMCHQKFFPASLKFHVKACAERKEHIELPCDYCDQLFLFAVLQTHMSMCRRAPARLKQLHTTQDLGNRRQQPNLTAWRGGVTPTVTANASPAKGATDPTPRQDTLGQDSKCERRGKFLTSYDSEALSEPVSGRNHNDDVQSTPTNATGTTNDITSIEGDGRVACTICQRKFSPDRVEVHQDICERVNRTEGRGRQDEKGELPGFHKPRRSSCPAFRCSGAKTPRTRGCSVGRDRDNTWWRTFRAGVPLANTLAEVAGDACGGPMGVDSGHQQRTLAHTDQVCFKSRDPEAMSSPTPPAGHFGRMTRSNWNTPYHRDLKEALSPCQKQESGEPQPARTQQPRSRPASAFAVGGSRGERSKFPRSGRGSSSLSPFGVAEHSSSCSSSPVSPGRDRGDSDVGRRGGDHSTVRNVMLPPDLLRGISGGGFRKGCVEVGGSGGLSPLLFFAPSWRAGRRTRLR